MSNFNAGPRDTPGQQPEHDQFNATIAVLTDGATQFPAPLDLLASALLAENQLAGSAATRYFDAARRAARRHLHIQVHEVIPGQPHLRRELVDCVLDRRVAAALLVGLAAELTPDTDRPHN